MGRKSIKRHRAPSGGDSARGGQLVARFAPRRFFTAEQAQAALIFLRPVVDDLQSAFHAAVECHNRLQCAVLREHVTRLIADQTQAIARFDRALDEVELAGAEVLDCQTCALAFPTRQQDGIRRLVWSPVDDCVRPADSLLN